MPRKKAENPFLVTKDDVADIRAGLQSPFWLALKKVISGNVESLKMKILDDSELDGEMITITKRDLARKWYGLNKELLELPASITEIRRTVETEATEFDPYPRTYEELMKMTKTR